MFYKPEIRTVKTEAYEMDYIVFGKGEKPLVVIPGVSVKPITRSAEVVAAAFARFGISHTLYVFDRKKNIVPGYTVSDMAEDTADAMRRLALDRADVFAASQGGMIALFIAARYPELVGRLFLASTLARQNDVSRATFDRWYDLAVGGDIRALNRDVFYRVYSDEYLEKYRRAFEALESDGTPAEAARFAVLAKACRTFDAWDELEKIRCPVFAVGSEKDRTLSPIGTRELAEKLGCRMYLYEGYGHAVYDEAPDYKELIAEFFS